MVALEASAADLIKKADLNCEPLPLDAEEKRSVDSHIPPVSCFYLALGLAHGLAEASQALAETSADKPQRSSIAGSAVALGACLAAFFSKPKEKGSSSDRRSAT
ncbi:MAG: hypothetical protein LBU12_00915 [Deltaproteobacteria bacterium]|jgi:hypothetical protein|nr:hypothetical protein [Deltaproteobacteria bacterium]